MLITSTDNKNIKEIRKLSNSKYSIEKGLFVIEGDHSIKEAIKNNLLVSLYVLEGNEYDFNYEYDIVTTKVMKSLSDMKSIPKCIGVCKKSDSKPLGNKIVILDGVQDPGNLGTIIRTSVAFGVDTILLSKNCVYEYNDKVIRSTEGMIFNINIIRCDLEAYLKTIKSNGIEVIGTSLNTNNSVKNIVKMDKYAVIFGNEGNGVSDNIQKQCDKLYKIDMNNNCESLNVAVSCGIILNKLFEG